jgi:hypothetical protein
MNKLLSNEITDPETVRRRLPLQNDIHLRQQRRQPECGHPKALENIRLFDHPHDELDRSLYATTIHRAACRASQGFIANRVGKEKTWVSMGSPEAAQVLEC